MPEPKSQSSRMTRQRLHEIIFVADTNLGQMFASLVMMPGYGIIAIPTGIVTAELAFAHQITTHPELSALSG